MAASAQGRGERMKQKLHCMTETKILNNLTQMMGGWSVGRGYGSGHRCLFCAPQVLTSVGCYTHGQRHVRGRVRVHRHRVRKRHWHAATRQRRHAHIRGGGSPLTRRCARSAHAMRIGGRQARGRVTRTRGALVAVQLRVVACVGRAGRGRALPRARRECGRWDVGGRCSAAYHAASRGTA